MERARNGILSVSWFTTHSYRAVMLCATSVDHFSPRPTFSDIFGMYICLFGVSFLILCCLQSFGPPLEAYSFVRTPLVRYFLILVKNTSSHIVSTDPSRCPVHTHHPENHWPVQKSVVHFYPRSTAKCSTSFLSITVFFWQYSIETSAFTTSYLGSLQRSDSLCFFVAK